MRTTARRLVAVLVAGLASAAILLVATDGPPTGEAARRGEDLQRLVGGLGLGPAVDLSRCGFSLDPRLCPDCPLNHAPIPGGVWFCPHHACAIRFCPRLGRAAGREER